MRRLGQFGVGVTAMVVVAFVGAPLASATSGDPVGGGTARTVSGTGPVPLLMGVQITFNGVPSAGNPILTHLSTQGYSFDGAHFHTIDSPTICIAGGCADDGTIYIGEEEGGLGQPFTMTRDTGGKFKLKHVSLAQFFQDDAAASAGGYPNATVVTLTGTKAGGAQVSRSFTPPDTGFATFNLPKSFKGLVSVKFSANGAFGADDIRIQQK
jgi:hypothetical protein